MGLLEVHTAVCFIGPVSTVVICIAAPRMRDASVVGTCELIGGARSWHPCGAVDLVAVIKAIIVPVAAPLCWHAALTGTGEGQGGTSSV